MSKATRRRYTAEFKAEAVGLVKQQGYGVAEAARALGINRSLLDRWLADQRDLTRDQARQDIVQYIEMQYNSNRLHSTLGYITAQEHEMALTA